MECLIMMTLLQKHLSQMSWEDFTNDDDEDLHRNQSMMSSSLLPSSLRDIIDESSNPNQMFMPNMNQDVSVPHSFDRRNLNFPFIGSAPIPNYGLNQDEVMFQGQIDPDERFHTNQYFQQEPLLVVFLVSNPAIQRR